MEDMLGKFQADLGNISTEIRALQEQSQTMSVKLKNRKGTEQKLSQFIESVAIPPALIEGVLQAEVDDTFHEHLLNLHRKLNFLEKNEAAQNSAAYKDVAPELEKLRVKAISKSRDYLMQRIYALRKPKTNIQILQQNVLLKYKYLVTFLRLHGGEVFTEVRVAYIDTLSRVLSSHFRAYLAAIERLKVCAPFWHPWYSHSYFGLHPPDARSFYIRSMESSKVISCTILSLLIWSIQEIGGFLSPFALFI